MKYYRAYSDGHMPFKGALTDQPNVIVEAFDEISLAKGVLDQEDYEKSREGNSSGNDGGD